MQTMSLSGIKDRKVLKKNIWPIDKDWVAAANFDFLVL